MSADPIEPIQRRVDLVRENFKPGTELEVVVHGLLLVVEAVTPLLRQLEMMRTQDLPGLREGLDRLAARVDGLEIELPDTTR